MPTNDITTTRIQTVNNVFILYYIKSRNVLFKKKANEIMY